MATLSERDRYQSSMPNQPSADADPAPGRVPPTTHRDPPIARPVVGARVLVVRDAADEPLSDALSRAGYEVVVVRSGEAALVLIDREPMELVILDTELPGISGFETCRRIRQFSDVPIMFAAVSASLEERVLGFDSGADDYITLPAEILEVDRRARALLRRARMSRAMRQVTGPAGIALDVRAHRAFVYDQQLQLTPKEFSIVQLLLERQGEVLSSDEISTQIWGYETFGARNFVEAHISRLRAKLAQAGARDIIETVRGVGYVIRPTMGEV